MERGDRVKVRAFGNRVLDRVVWDDCGTYVAVCRPEVYASASLLGREPIAVMGFPKEDVHASEA